MKLLDNIRQRRDLRKLNRLYDTEIQTNVPALAQRIFSEDSTRQTGMPEFNPVLLSDMLGQHRPSGRKFNRFIMERRKVTSKTFSNITMVRSPFMYDRIDAFYNRESYFSRSLIRQVETMMRNGYGFSSDDTEILGTLKKEIARIQMDSMMPLDQTLFSAAISLLKYGVVILQKVRERIKDEMAIDDKRKNRITKLRIIKPHNALFYVNDRGRLVGVQDGSFSVIAQAIQKMIGGSFFGIPAEDIMIAYMADPGDEMFPEPPCFQMLDDIMTLRSIEETIELLCFQFGSPLLHTQVGTDELPSSPDEVRGVNDAIINMAPNGMITTDHRTKVTAVNLQSGVANLVPYLEHFKNRVLMGSGSSPISVGEGNSANRNTAESIDDALADHCTYLASALTAPINFNLIPDLLVRAETTYEDPDLFDETGEMKVRMIFNEMRLEKEIARHNDIINLWEGNIITHPEARRMLKFSPIGDGAENDLFVNMVQIPVKEAGPVNAFAGGDSTGSVSAKTRSQNQPTNQHGTKAGPGSRRD